jgi:mRNA interferase MazF
VLVAGPTPSVALADQVRSLDWRQRGAKKKGAASPAELAEIPAKLRALLG